MTPAAQEIVAAIATHPAKTDEARLLVRMAAAALMAEGVAPTIPQPPSSTPPRRTSTERVRDWRAAQRNVTPETSRETATETRDETPHVTLVSSLSRSPSLSPSSGFSLNLPEEETRERNTETPSVTADETRRETLETNATRDGAFGMLVSAWADGIRSVTGGDMRPPRGKPAGELGDRLRLACAGATDQCAAARAIGAEYARARAGTVLSPFGFGDWVGSGKPERASGVIRVQGARGAQLVQPRSEKPAWKVGVSK